MIWGTQFLPFFFPNLKSYTGAPRRAPSSLGVGEPFPGGLARARAWGGGPVSRHGTGAQIVRLSSWVSLVGAVGP